MGLLLGGTEHSPSPDAKARTEATAGSRVARDTHLASPEWGRVSGEPDKHVKGAAFGGVGSTTSPVGVRERQAAPDTDYGATSRS